MTRVNIEQPDHSPRVGPGFMLGVYLGVNALRDLYLLVEGPDCTHIKTQYIQGNHDWLSTLTSVSGFHRIANTALHPDEMGGSREGALRAKLLEMAAHAAVPAVALTSMPMATITGADYDRLCDEVADTSGKPVLSITGKSLSHDWLDGYAAVLDALAIQIDLPETKKAPNTVALVGYLFDRNEADHTGNLVELERMLGEVGLKLCSVWLGGQPLAELCAIAQAETIISLPYGRRAARTLAKRTGARLVELELPFGLPASEAWLRQVAKHCSVEQRAESFIDNELRKIAPKLEWLVPFFFQGRSIGYVGDPHMATGLASFVELLGARMRFVVITNRPVHARALERLVGDEDLLIYPKTKSLQSFLAQRFGSTDLVVASDLAHLDCPVASFELGFPSPTRHALYQRPFLGFSGALALVDSLANQMALGAVGHP